MTARPPVGVGAATLPLVTRHFVALDTPLAISVENPRLDGAIDRLLADFAAPPGPSAIRYSLSTDDTDVSVHREGGARHRGAEAGALSWLLTDVNREVLNRYRGYAVHAGAVAADGVAICFPGPSGLGKSTLAAACLLAGLDYVSDEALCVGGPGLLITPYPRPLTLSPHSLELLDLSIPGGEAPPDRDTGAEHCLSAACLGGRSVDGPIPLGHIVHLERAVGPPSLEPLDRAASVPLLVSLSFNLYKRPESNLELVAAMARRTSSWRLRYHDPLHAAALLAERLG
jgi:hypothetical protein